MRRRGLLLFDSLDAMSDQWSAGTATRFFTRSCPLWLGITFDELLRGEVEPGYRLARRHDPRAAPEGRALPLLDDPLVGAAGVPSLARRGGVLVRCRARRGRRAGRRRPELFDAIAPRVRLPTHACPQAWPAAWG